ncbi:MAG: hypothetical protein KKH98_10525 [Spirochaetes bacterium]|nr:hypothetical protein [Spirochaetota bacterium]
MQKTWEERHTIKTFDVDFNRKLKLNALFKYFQEIASNHAEHLGWGYEALQKKGFFWLLSRMKINVKRLPEWKEDVVIQTWPKGVERLFALRDFLIMDKEKRVIVEASSVWILYDIKASRPARVEKFIKDPGLFSSRHAVNEVPGRIEPSDELETVNEKKVVYSDIDVNEHVNNTRYLEWIQDSFDREMFQKQNIQSLQVNFLKEVRYSDTVLIKKSQDRDGLTMIQMEDKESGSVILRSAVQWK